VTAVATTVLELYRQGVKIPDIASDQELEISVIKALLAAHCEEYRIAVEDEANKVIAAEMGVGENQVQASEEPEKKLSNRPSDNSSLAITDTEMLHIKRTMFTIMDESDNDSVRLKAAIYLSEEGLGRNERRIASAAEAGKLNPLMLNEVMKRANAALQRAGKVIDVPV
jgi:hypothetical protein